MTRRATFPCTHLTGRPISARADSRSFTCKILEWTTATFHSLSANIWKQIQLMCCGLGCDVNWSWKLCTVLIINLHTTEIICFIVRSHCTSYASTYICPSANSLTPTFWLKANQDTSADHGHSHCLTWSRIPRRSSCRRAPGTGRGGSPARWPTPSTPLFTLLKGHQHISQAVFHSLNLISLTTVPFLFGFTVSHVTIDSSGHFIFRSKAARRQSWLHFADTYRVDQNLGG